MYKYFKKLIPNCCIKRHLDKNARKSVLLTFDDGPSPGITVQVLDLLKKYQARAVFFVVGNRVDKYPDILKEMVAQGHLIGNHTYRHPNGSPFPFFKYRRDVLECQNKIKEVAGITPFLFRPARGIITLSGLLAIKTLGMKNIFWSCDGGEWSFNKGKTAVEIYENLIPQIKGGDIILLHNDHPLMTEVLGRLLEYLHQKGYDLAHGVDYL